MCRPRSSADSSTWRSATRSSELAPEDGHPQCIRGGRPFSRSDRERNPDPEEVEAPLVVTGIPHRLLLEAPVVDWRRRRSPRLRQRSIPRWRRRCAPAPGRQIITPRGTVESTAPVVVPGVPWWSPVVVVGSAEVTRGWTAGSAGSAEVTRGRTAGSAGSAEVTLWRTAGSAGSAEVTLWRTARSALLRWSAGAALRWPAGSALRRWPARTAWAALSLWRRHARRCGVGNA